VALTKVFGQRFLFLLITDKPTAALALYQCGPLIWILFFTKFEVRRIATHARQSIG
jgi:hypothetical protein